MPVHLFVGKYDRLATVKDAHKLFGELANSPNKVVSLFYFRPILNYNLDMLLSYGAKTCRFWIRWLT